MDDWFARLIGSKVTLRYIGDLVGTVHQYVVPGLVSAGLGMVRLVPVFGRLAGWIEFHDQPAIVVAQVMDDLT